VRGPVGWDDMQGEGSGMGGWEIGEGVGWEGQRIRWGSGILGRFANRPIIPILLDCTGHAAVTGGGWISVRRVDTM
jgi:hypothetical protein